MDSRFLDLVKEQGGFEICLGFRDNEDHFIGGTGDTVWYFRVKGRTQELWLSEQKGGTRTDRYLCKKKTLTEKPAAPGTVLSMIGERLFFKQAELAGSGRKPVPVEIHGLKCSHYVFSFGARAYDILDDFGVTACYSNIDDELAGWRFRDVRTGKKITVPKLN